MPAGPKEKKTRPAGLEPATFGFEVRNDKNISAEETKAYEPAKEPLTLKRTPKRKKEKFNTSELPPDLAELVTVWSELPEHIKQTIRTIVAVTVKEKRQ